MCSLGRWGFFHKVSLPASGSFGCHRFFPDRPVGTNSGLSFSVAIFTESTTHIPTLLYLQWESIKIKLNFMVGAGNYPVKKTPFVRAVTCYFSVFALDPMRPDGYSYILVGSGFKTPSKAQWLCCGPPQNVRLIPAAGGTALSRRLAPCP
jgi:hypothetical protein